MAVMKNSFGSPRSFPAAPAEMSAPPAMRAFAARLAGFGGALRIVPEIAARILATLAAARVMEAMTKQ
jgi:hypothetical protein